MKHLRKIALATIVISASIASSMAFADDTATTTSVTETETWSTMPKTWKMAEIKAAREDLRAAREDRKVARQTLIENNQKLRDEAKQNRATFKAENDSLKELFSTLSSDIQAQLKTLNKEHRATIDSLKLELTGSWITEERKTEIITQIKSLNEANIAKIKEIVWTWSTEIDSYFAKKEELIATNVALRTQAKQAREEFRQWKNEIVDKYKDIYFAQLKNLIPKLSDTRLETISSKIDATITKIETNTTMSEDRKTKMLAQLTSIKEIIQEEQDSRTNIDETFDVNTILE